MLKNLVLLTSPPASGKTHMIKELCQVAEQKPLVIVPLRALADECKQKWGLLCDVMTPEEWLIKNSLNEIVIFDEFHLYFYWGDTFRPQMWEAFYALASEANLTLLLTATIGPSMRLEMEKLFSNFDHVVHLDYGNQKLKNKPLRYFKLPSKLFLQDVLLQLNWKGGVNLVFCAYRQEVFQLKKKLEEKGYRVWSCVGGESSAFSRQVQEQSPPDFIVATTVLSHGVNLPGISRIFFTYPVENMDFWIQMVARGGRKGESYEVYALENPFGIKWKPWINHLAIQRLGLRMKAREIFQQIQAWFLKA